MGYNYIPKYIRQSENKSPKSVVTASRWNTLFNLLIQQGDHTAEELGKILDYLSTGLEDLTIDISGKQDKATLEADVAAKGFTKNTGTYSKPADGIPKADLAAAVQTSLDKADSALQSVPSTYRTAAAQDTIDSGKQDKATLEADVSAAGFTKNTGTYSKPTDGIPKSDLANDVQASLGKANTALQHVPTAYRTAILQDKIDSGKVDKVDGKGLSSNDYTAAAKAKVDAIPANPKYTDTVYDDTALKERVATIEGKESAWDAKSDFSGSYNDLTDKPTIPAEVTPLSGKIENITPTQVAEAVSAGRPVFLNSGFRFYTAFNASYFGAFSSFINDNETIQWLIGNTDTDTWTEGDISVPTKTSQLTNDSGYLTLATLPIYNGEVQ